MIRRLRPNHPPQRLKEIYATPHQHDQWEDHVNRVDRTVKLAKQLMTPEDTTGADLSCGDAAIIKRLGLKRTYLGDFAPGYEYMGFIEATITHIPKVDVFVCCETLEHLDDPVGTLKLIRAKTTKLIVSTPLNEQTDENEEHLWVWDRDGIDQILRQAGFIPNLYEETVLKSGWYQFQIWGCL